MVDTKKKRILIVEDEVPIARALELKLQNSGFDAKVARNGREALDEIEQDGIDLMLLDLVMPEMDGFSVLTKLKQKDANVPVIVLSNLSQEEDLRRAKKLGITDYFVKSDTPIADVVTHINEVLKREEKS